MNVQLVIIVKSMRLKRSNAQLAITERRGRLRLWESVQHVMEVITAQLAQSSLKCVLQERNAQQDLWQKPIAQLENIVHQRLQLLLSALKLIIAQKAHTSISNV